MRDERIGDRFISRFTGPERVAPMSPEADGLWRGMERGLALTRPWRSALCLSVCRGRADREREAAPLRPLMACHLFGFEVSIRETGPMREIQRTGQIVGAEWVCARQGERVDSLLFKARSRPINPNRLSWSQGSSGRDLPGRLESGRPGAQRGVACLTSNIRL